ncbi:MAG: N-formylglutamate amidohydrolase [Motiliproteus sp.]
MTLPVILHIPHASRALPAKDLVGFLRPTDNMEIELDRLTDHFTDEIFRADQPEITRVIFPVSRYLVDPERFPVDEEEPMASHGMGVLYTDDTQLRPYRRPVNSWERKRLLDRYYYPHHAALDQATELALKKAEAVLFIDCHSFPDQALPCDLDQSPIRPDICLGTDPYHTPDKLLETVKAVFEQSGYCVTVNSPYAGTLIPNIAYRKGRRVVGLMIELNRRLYLKTGTIAEKDQERLSALTKVINDVIAAAREIKM